MPTTSVNIGFRPPRVATLVRPDSPSEIAETAAANTHLWGGHYNPIIAVGDDVDAAVDKLQLFRPDLVTVIGEPTGEQSAVLASMQHLAAPALAHPGEPFKATVDLDRTVRGA